MRYRSFSQTGATASAVSLVLPDVRMREADRIALVHAALESGINTFEIQSQDAEIGLALAKALGSVDRRLVNVGLRVAWSRRAAAGQPMGAAAVAGLCEAMVGQAGLKWLDMAVLDAPDADPPPYDAIAALQNEKARGRVRRLGVGGDGEVAQGYVRSGGFEILATTFNVHSGWAARNRIREAADREMAVIACDRYPSREAPALPAALGGAGGLLRRLLTRRAPAPKTAGSRFAFLKETPGWTPEEICLAYALTEPAITTIQIDPLDADSLRSLAEVPERELPNGLAAQIEMARFSAMGDERPVDMRRRRA